MKVNRSTMVAWAAGFIDGEGSISLNVGSPGHAQRRHPGQMKLFLTATNTVREPLERLVEIFGGHINLLKGRTEKHREVFSWRQTNSKALDTIRELQPLMTTRGEQAKVAEEFMVGMTGTTWGPTGMPDWEIDRRVRLKQRMQALNRRGPGRIEVGAT